MRKCNELCLFDCPEIGAKSRSIEQAVEWHKQGNMVAFVYKGKHVGLISYAGECVSSNVLPVGADYGIVVFCKEDEAFYISTPKK